MRRGKWEMWRSGDLRQEKHPKQKEEKKNSMMDLKVTPWKRSLALFVDNLAPPLCAFKEGNNIRLSRRIRRIGNWLIWAGHFFSSIYQKPSTMNTQFQSLYNYYFHCISQMPKYWIMKYIPFHIYLSQFTSFATYHLHSGALVAPLTTLYQESSVCIMSYMVEPRIPQLCAHHLTSFPIKYMQWIKVMLCRIL